MKKVVIFYKSYQKYGGQEKVVWEFSNYLANSGYLVDIYTAKNKDKPENKNIKIKRVFIPKFGEGLRTLFFALYAYSKAKKIEGFCVFGFGKTFYQDLYCSGGGVHKYYFKRAKLKYKSNVARFFYIFRKMLSLSHWINIWIEEKTFNNEKLKIIIVPSEFVKKQILTAFNKIDEKKIKLVRNDVKLAQFDYKKRIEIGKKTKEELEIDGQEITFAFVSTNHRLKGLEYLLDACLILKERGYNFKLIVAGNGSHSYFKKKIKRYGLCKEIKYLGIIEKIENIYYASDFLIYPSLFDTFGLVVLEAMACGTPVFCSEYAGASEIIKDNNFIIHNPQDSEEIASKMIYAIENVKKWQVWRNEVLNIAQKHSSNTAYKKMMEFIEEIYVK